MSAPQEPTELSLERFRALVEAYGSDLSRMPAEERAGAQALLARSEAARELLEQARAVDAWLALSHEVVVAPSLMRALESIPDRHRQEGVVRQLVPVRARVWTALSAAAALLLGVWSGAEGAGETSELASRDVGQEDLMPAEAQEDLALAELSALALGEALITDLHNLEGAWE